LKKGVGKKGKIQGKGGGKWKVADQLMVTWQKPKGKGGGRDVAACTQGGISGGGDGVTKKVTIGKRGKGQFRKRKEGERNSLKETLGERSGSSKGSVEEAR